MAVRVPVNQLIEGRLLFKVPLGVEGTASVSNALKKHKHFSVTYVYGRKAKVHIHVAEKVSKPIILAR